MKGKEVSHTHITFHHFAVLDCSLSRGGGNATASCLEDTGHYVQVDEQ